MKALSNLNMRQNELKGLAIDRLAVAPSNPKENSCTIIPLRVKYAYNEAKTRFML